MSFRRKADRVADDLLRRIVAGHIDVGETLPTEAELAERYEVNRGVVREAVKLLEVHRLVRPVRRRGTVVLDPMRSLSAEVLRAMLAPTPSQIDRDVLADLLEVRADLDVKMSAMAARRRTDQDLIELDAIIDRLRDSVRDLPTYDDAIDDLSEALARATHNRIFEMLSAWNQLVVRDLRDVFRVARPAGGPHVDGLAYLVTLIRERRADDAGALVRAYHDWAIPRLLAQAELRGGAPLQSIAGGEAR